MKEIMENKHPIDNLFADKLQGHEMKPSAASWQKIRRDSTKSGNRFRLTYWMIAAACLLVGIMLTIQQNEPLPDSVTMANQMQTQESPAFRKALDISNESSVQVPLDKNEIALSNKKVVRVAKKNISLDVENEHETPPTTNHMETLDKSSEKMELTLENSLTDTEEIGVNQPSTQALTPEPMQTVVPRVIIAEVIEGNEETKESVKKKKFNRIIRQLKNLKDGQEVDWEEVGVNPRELLAKVDPLQLEKR